MSAIARYRGEFRWEAVPVEPYQAADGPFRDVSRQRLFGGEASLPGELRYFEVAAGGHTSLERHEHAHAVVVLRGAGRVLVGSEIADVRPFDLVRVAPSTWHQFRATGDEPLGFLCLVDRERDRPRRPTSAELETLRADPAVAEFIRT